MQFEEELYFELPESANLFKLSFEKYARTAEEALGDRFHKVPIAKWKEDFETAKAHEAERLKKNSEKE